MKKINAKFNSKCAETGKKIAKGDDMYYNYGTKKCYCMTSNAAINAAKETDDQAGVNQDGELVAAQENAYFDNFYATNY